MAEESSPNTDDKIVSLLEELIVVQKDTVAAVDQHRGHLRFYTLMIILGFILWFFVFFIALIS